ncbi:hypothetical protein [Bifidobacterium parmae]|uniref:TP901 family phage tail tape measure protein n=1 Tax=Bifidobacterium parmae TaxID=361854 RepID=A0A2N5IVI9_9BIFI|nr:hypothetical protein [Bifidobacterium parmae]PLS25974.1 TP901 family phage tail tape measure protein [Bifidobacterium parmae]
MPGLVARLKCARSLGMSLKRFDGWEPTDDDPTEWDETERTWMLALQAYEDGLCPVCGMPTRVCHDQDETERRWAGADVEICNVAYLRNKALRSYRDSGAPDPDADGAITTRLTPTRPITQD